MSKNPNPINKKWKIAKCWSPDCWCRLIVVYDAKQDNDGDYSLGDCIVRSGELDEKTAKHIVYIHNQWLKNRKR